ncbi:glucokinase [Enterococcus sp. DIV2402]|uniref:Glucokinase n=1 Tax=Candidatus Enterococcus lowellii TaxID=2230877 RepID=A0ABZ2SM62_9ENTE|nr:ROK family protein [Enterococcus sp. DIV2402]MBO0464581.1 ROK family protein [Enterococcus sp. DIV2402]
MKGYYFLMDVGGTTIKTNCLDEQGLPFFTRNQEFPAKSQEDQQTILENFYAIVTTINRQMAQKAQLLGVGIAFPGPFNYQEGYSLMKGLRKYDEIYEVRLKKLIAEWLYSEFQLSVPIIFENDATAFGLGEFLQREKSRVNRGIYLTLGTGCGSAFIVEGEVIREEYGLNSQGMLYNRPFKQSIIDDYLSANGLQQLIKNNYSVPLTGYELFLEAQKGNQKALVIFDEFGTWIGEALAPFVTSFQPDEVVFGGEISGSLDYFHPAIERCFGGNLKIRYSQNTSLSTLRGLMSLVTNG